MARLLDIDYESVVGMKFSVAVFKLAFVLVAEALSTSGLSKMLNSV